MPRPSGASAIPASTISCGGSASRSCPSKVTREPDCGWISPAIDLSKVDLPAPFAPSITTISPGFTSRSTPESAECLP